MSEKEEKKLISEVKASAKGIHISPRKARLVANLLKNLPVVEALTHLGFLTKKAAQPIKKLVNSAVASASHNFQIEADRLFIKSLTVDQGRVFFRYQPRAQGRALPVRKRTSHLNLILGVTHHPLRKAKAVKSEPVLKKEEVKTETVVKTPVKGAGRFAFWRKKKPQDTSQLAPKEDVKGKHYTAFDRRGNM